MGLIEDIFGKPKKKRGKTVRRRRKKTTKKKPANPRYARMTITQLNAEMDRIRRSRGSYTRSGKLTVAARKKIQSAAAYKGARRVKYKAPKGGRHK